MEHLFNVFHIDCISTCCCGDVGRIVFVISLFLSRRRLIEGSHLIDKLLNFVMYNAINHGVSVTCCYGCWLITESIFFLFGHELGKVCICFIDICFFAPFFDCFFENSECMYIVSEEA